MPFIEDEELKQLKKNFEKEKLSNMKLLDFNGKKASEAEKYRKSKSRMMLLTVVFATCFYSILFILFFEPSWLIDVFSSESELHAVEMTKEALDLQEKLIKRDITIDSFMAVNEELSQKNLEVKTDTVEIVPDYYKQHEYFQNFLRGKKIYSVQLGIFKERNIIPLSKSFINFKGTRKSEYFVYSIGNFLKKEEAEYFREQLLKMGVKDCFIIDYKLN